MVLLGLILLVPFLAAVALAIHRLSSVADRRVGALVDGLVRKIDLRIAI